MSYLNNKIVGTYMAYYEHKILIYDFKLNEGNLTLQIVSIERILISNNMYL